MNISKKTEADSQRWRSRLVVAKRSGGERGNGLETGLVVRVAKLQSPNV